MHVTAAFTVPVQRMRMMLALWQLQLHMIKHSKCVQRAAATATRPASSQ